MSKTFQSLKIRCAEAGTSISEVCRIAGVNRSTVEKWKKDEPTTLVVLEKLNNAIEELKRKKQ